MDMAEACRGPRWQRSDMECNTAEYCSRHTIVPAMSLGVGARTGPPCKTMRCAEPAGSLLPVALSVEAHTRWHQQRCAQVERLAGGRRERPAHCVHA